MYKRQPYGNTKQINEEIIRDTVASGAPINAIMLRYFNPIGAHPTALPVSYTQLLSVRIVQTSACAACSVKGHCSSADSKDKIIDIIDTAAASYQASGFLLCVQ